MHRFNPVIIDFLLSCDHHNNESFPCLESLKVVKLVSLNYENLPEFQFSLCYPGIIADQSINTEFLHLIIKTDLNKKDSSYRTGLHAIL